jgi:hypothetical protein
MSFTKGNRVIEERPLTGKLRLQKLVDGAWKTTAFAPDLEACKRHAAAVGGSVQVLDKAGVVVATFGVKIA